jgi:hypothetical protein
MKIIKINQNQLQNEYVDIKDITNWKRNLKSPYSLKLTDYIQTDSQIHFIITNVEVVFDYFEGYENNLDYTYYDYKYECFLNLNDLFYSLGLDYYPPDNDNNFIGIDDIVINLLLNRKEFKDCDSIYSATIMVKKPTKELRDIRLEMIGIV